MSVGLYGREDNQAVPVQNPQEVVALHSLCVWADIVVNENLYRDISMPRRVFSVNFTNSTTDILRLLGVPNVHKTDHGP